VTYGAQAINYNRQIAGHEVVATATHVLEWTRGCSVRDLGVAMGAISSFAEGGAVNRRACGPPQLSSQLDQGVR